MKAAIETNNRKEAVKTDHKLEEFKSGPFVKFLQERLEKFVVDKSIEQI